MAGEIRRLLNEIINARSQGDRIIANTTKAKLIMKGITMDKYDDNSPDDPVIIEKIHQIAKEMGVTL